MPDTTEENETIPGSGRFGKLTTWWKKFHFSGRLIMCSVLFGLGLVLIGGLVFAINVDDDSSSNPVSDNISDQIPTKAPARYAGPVVMGLGGFIVVVGVIMCLFETQVCRKKSGDSSPLITDKTDPESKDSDTVAGPLHGHKKHKHGTRKIPGSPRKSKSKHGKSNSKEKGRDKTPSQRSPPVSIDKSKSYMTSSEEKFLTPPTVTSSVLEGSNSNTAENATSPSLMKSFTSSGPSWTQSTEFLTPSTSFKDNSTSLNNSVELDEKQQRANFMTSEEYLTPRAVEDRIEKLLLGEKEEQEDINEEELKGKTDEMNVNSKYEKKITESSDIQNKIGKEFTAEALSNTSVEDVLELKGVSQPDTTDLKNGEINEDKNCQDEKLSDKCDNIAFPAENPVKNDAYKAIPHVTDEVNDKQEFSIVSDTPPSKLLLHENVQNSDHNPIKKVTGDDNKSYLENSVSSDETLVSPDTFSAKSKIEANVESTSLETSSQDKHHEAGNILESLNNAKLLEDSIKNAQISDPSNVTKETDTGSDNLRHSEGDTKADNHAKKISDVDCE